MVWGKLTNMEVKYMLVLCCLFQVLNSPCKIDRSNLVWYKWIRINAIRLAMLLLDPWQADSYKRNQSVMRSTPPTQTDQHRALFTTVYCSLRRNFSLQCILQYIVILCELHVSYPTHPNWPAQCIMPTLYFALQSILHYRVPLYEKHESYPTYLHWPALCIFHYSALFSAFWITVRSI